MKRLCGRLLPVLLALSILAGCAPAEEPEEGGLKLWFTTVAGSAGETAKVQGHTGEALKTQRYDGPASVEDMMSALLAGPADGETCANPFPAGTRLLDWSQENGILRVDLSQQYSGLVGVDLTLADYCITLTLTQLEEVRGVVITVNGSELPYRDRQVLYPEDVMFSGAEEEPVDVSAALYFRRGDGDTLGFEQRNFRLTESESPPLAVLQALVNGPEDEGLTRLLPEGLEIYSARMDDGVCAVDLSGVFLETAPSDPREQALVLYSIVNTLCSLESVELVQIMVEGMEQDRYGELDISQPLAAGDGTSLTGNSLLTK